MAALLIGIFGAIRFSDQVAIYLQQELSMDERYLPIASFAITFIGLVILVHLLGRMLEKLIDMVALGFLNRLGGSVFRGLKMALIISVLINMIQSLDADLGIVPEETLKQSVLYPIAAQLAPAIIPAVRDNT